MAKAPTEIRSLARSHTETAIKTLVSIMNQTKAPPSARVAAATAILDRGWGKPNQKIEGDLGHRYVAVMPQAIDDVEEWQRTYMPNNEQQ